MNLERFDLNLLRVLDALLSERQVSSAARRLGLSQPAVSSALARLRKALGDSLLLRSGNRMVLTPLAVELQPRVSRALDDIDIALNAATAFDPHTTHRVFRIGADDYVTVVLLASLAARMRVEAPHAVLEIWPYDDLFEERLTLRDWDLAVTDRWALRTWRHCDVLLRETFVSIARADHPRLGNGVVNLESFLAEDHALVSRRGRTAGVVDAGLEPLARRRRIVLTLPHYLAASAMIATTDLVMTLPRRVAERTAAQDGVRRFETPLTLEGFEIAAAYHPRSASDAGILWLRR
ncbi:MAG TPA: LysR family transcriptional regulator, partial [Povalibacter sp.]|nr:LysR family transcriptional regulator [Povalibacter sp.]